MPSSPRPMGETYLRRLSDIEFSSGVVGNNAGSGVHLLCNRRRTRAKSVVRVKLMDVTFRNRNNLCHTVSLADNSISEAPVLNLATGAACNQCEYRLQSNI